MDVNVVILTQCQQPMLSALEIVLLHYASSPSHTYQRSPEPKIGFLPWFEHAGQPLDGGSRQIEYRHAYGPLAIERT